MEDYKKRHSLMKCGCVAQGTMTQKGTQKFDPPLPVCITHQCIELAAVEPNLTGRIAYCCYGHGPNHRSDYGSKGQAPSSYTLPFFVYHPDRESDEYYCGCFGWE